MCEMAMVVLSALALLTLILVARWEGRRKDERARRDGLVIDGHPVDEPPHGPESGHHDAERGDQRYVSVGELIERERRAAFRRRAAAQQTTPIRRIKAPVRRPSPHPRNDHR